MSLKNSESHNQSERIFELFNELKLLLENRELEDLSRFDPSGNKRISAETLKELYEQKEKEVNEFQKAWDSLDDIDKLVTQNLQRSMHETNTINQFLHQLKKQDKNNIKKNKRGQNGVWRAEDM